MSRILAALFVVALSLAFAAAQEQKPVRLPFGGAKSQVPFDVIEVDGKTAWRIAGRGNTRVEELAGGLSTAVNKRVVYSYEGAKQSRENVPYVGPNGGIVVNNADLVGAVSELIEPAGLTLTGHGDYVIRVVSLHEAFGYARYIERSELASAPDTEWVVLQGTTEFLRGDLYVLQNSHMRGYGAARVSIKASPYGYSISGRAHQVRNALKVIESFDKPGAGQNGMIVRTYTLGPNQKASDAKSVLDELFKRDQTHLRDLDSNYTAVSEKGALVRVSAVGESKLIVRASTTDHAMVKSALDSLK